MSNKGSLFETELDLNKLFNMSYNFDLLKNIIEGLIKNQKNLNNELNALREADKKKGEKIIKIEKDFLNNIIELEKDPEKIKALNEKKEQIEKVSKEEEKEFFQPAPLSYFESFEPVQPPKNDELTNILVEKVNELEKKVEDNKNIINSQQEKIQELSDKLSELEIKSNDLDVLEILKNAKGIGDEKDGENKSLSLQLISNLEKKFLQKFKLVDERLKKNENYIKSVKQNEEGVTESANTPQKIVESSYTESSHENLNQMLALVKKEIFEVIEKKYFTKDNNPQAIKELVDSKLNPMAEKMVKLNMALDSAKELLKNKNSQYDKIFKDLESNFSNGLTQIKAINDKIGIFSTNEDLASVKKSLENEIANEVRDLKLETAVQKKSLDNLKEQLIQILDDKSDHDDIEIIKRKLESVVSTLALYRDFESKVTQQLNAKPVFEPSKYVETTKFEAYKVYIAKEFDKVKETFEKVNREIDNIVQNLMKSKASMRDLRNLEDSAMSKLEDLRIASAKQFADKIETMKNFKYLEQQIKQVYENGMKNVDKSDNWLLAKKPMGGHLCASCEAYIGDLKESTQYVPWNKIPLKENDKFYRIGTGFSKMLQMVSVEEKKSPRNFQTIQEFYNPKSDDEEQRENSCPREGGGGMCNSNGFGSLPNIKKMRRNNSMAADCGKDEVIGDYFDMKKEDKQRPKIMKIYKKIKNEK